VQRLLEKEVACIDWLDEKLQACSLFIGIEIGRRKPCNDTLASQLRKLLLQFKSKEITDLRPSVAGDEDRPGPFGFQLTAFWVPPANEAQLFAAIVANDDGILPYVDNRQELPDNQANIDPSAVVADETGDGPSLSPSEREGSDMGDAYTTDAQLLFETVKSFRAIRDRVRMSKLATALGLSVPAGEAPTIQEIEKLVNKLCGKSFGSFDANYIAAQEIQGMLNDLGLRIACPKARCHKPSSLHCTTAKRTKHGKFVFIHPGLRGQAHHGGWITLPQQLSLIPSTARSRRSHPPANRN
jgi:hypothetical protein